MAFFMPYTFYIIYSRNSDRYYVGSTAGAMSERLRRHNSNHKGFTGRSNDWELKYFEGFDTVSAARKREQEVKGWKSRKRIERLIGD